MPVLRNASRLSVMFDDDHAVAGAGLALVGVLSEKLGLVELAEELVDVRPFPGRRVATLVHAIAAGAQCIDDADLLRSASTDEVLGHKVMAPSTLGTFLHTFDFRHLRQLGRLSELLLARAWAMGAGPGSSPMTIDLDSTICEVHSKQKHGAAYGYTKVLGYNLLLATRTETGEVFHVRFQKGSGGSGRGAQHFVHELVGRIRRCDATGSLTLWADAGFSSAKVMQACVDHGVAYAITAPQNPLVSAAIGQINEGVWRPIDCTHNGEASVADTDYQGHRLIVRRTKLTGPQPELFPTFCYHAFVTNRAGDAVLFDADHRRHAVVELAIRDLKENAGLSHLPSGRFGANGAWAVLASIAHNLVRWLAALGMKTTGPLVGKTIRRRFLALPGRLTRSARRRFLHLATSWPWAEQWLAAYERLCSLRT